MAKADPAVRSKKSNFLKALVKQGKVSSPKDAHGALKKEFGSSLTFSEVAGIIGKPGRKKRKKGAAKPKRGAAKPKAGRGRKRGRPPGRGSKDHPFAIVNASDEVLLVKTRAQAVEEITRLVGAQDSSEGISLYKKVPISVEKIYRIGL